MSEPLLIAIIIASFLVVFPLFWSSVVALIAFAGGWRKLAAAYPAQPSDSAEWRTMCSASLGRFIGLGHYRSSLNIGKDDTFVHFKPIWAFTMYHPKISVPRVDVTARGQSDRLISLARLDFARSDVPMRVSGRLATWILASDE